MSNTTSPNMNSVSDDNESPSPDLTGYGYYTFGLSIGVLLLFCLITVAMYYFSSRRNPTTDTNETITAAGDHHHHLSPPSRAATGVDDSTLRSYPAVLYSELAKSWKLQLDDWDWRRGCSICLGDYKESEWVRVLPECAHLFHRNCIDVWLRMNSSCPLCRNSPLPSPIAQVAPLVPTRG